jgi:hypothetical protein
MVVSQRDMQISHYLEGRKGTMATRELVEAALRVLVAWNGGCDPPATDLVSVRNAFPASVKLSDDELACQVIHALSRSAFDETTGEDDSAGVPEVA